MIDEDGESQEQPVWNLRVAKEDADRFIKGLGWPKQSRPDSLGGEYRFPENVRDLSSVQLGSLQLQLTSWMSWAEQELGRERSERDAYQQVYDIRLGLAMNAARVARADQKGTIVKEVLAALALQDSTLKAMHQKLISWGLRITRMEAQVGIYEKQIRALSREQSRREAEARLT